MQNKIRDFLDHLAFKNEITILFACESGSRAWGFPSKDSDYDIRIIYKHDLDWYLNLHKQDDTLEQVHEDLDMGGWELRKSLLLLAKSNVSLFEWIQSPLIYKQVPDFRESMYKLAAYFFSPIATQHHYQSMAGKYMEKIKKGDKVKLKDFFYALRAILSATWIGKYHEIPPLDISRMQGLFSEAQNKKVNELKALKASHDEKFRSEIDSDLIHWLQSNFENNQQIALTLPAGKGDMTRLSKFFKRVIKDD